jgi:hypothetical protein
MNLRTIFAGLACFAAGAVFALTTTDALARPGRAAVPAAYSNSVYGFSIIPPTYPKVEADSATQAAMFFAPAKGGFASNLGVMIQTTKMSIDEYVKLSQTQFKQADLKIVSENKLKVSGRDAVLWEYEGTAKDRELKFMALAVADKDRVFLVTATAPKPEYEALAKEFKASLNSFKIED